MGHLLIVGKRPELLGLIPLLHSLETGVTLLREPAEVTSLAERRFDLVVSEVQRRDELEPLAAFARRGSLWLVCLAEQASDLGVAAYERGALAVLPAGASSELIRTAISRLLGLDSSAGQRAVAVSERRYQAGDFISLPEDVALEVVEGVVAHTLLHSDGSEALVGMCGPGAIITGQTDATCFLHDPCHFQLQAYTPVVVYQRRWSEWRRQADVANRLRDQLQEMRTWAAMQSRTSMEERLYGLLSLFAEQFGRDVAAGRLLDLRLTHMQLASAIGATRTTITRILGQLRRRGEIVMVATENGERLCLPVHGRRASAADSETSVAPLPVGSTQPLVDTSFDAR